MLAFYQLDGLKSKNFLSVDSIDRRQWRATRQLDTDAPGLETRCFLIFRARLTFSFLFFSDACLLQALQSLSLTDSRLRSRGTILVNALGSNTCLRKVDLSGNNMDDIGAKMLSKALQINTTLR